MTIDPELAKMITHEADFRAVCSRLAMSPGTLVPSPVPDNRIEVFASPSGTSATVNSRCKDNTYMGQKPCCDWMVDMYVRYFSGETTCTSLSCT